MKAHNVRLNRHQLFGALRRASFGLFLAGMWCAPSAAQQASDRCPTPAALQENAFAGSMQFSMATNKGNMNTSSWISATGRIERDTPARLMAFLEAAEYVPGQIVFNSPGGNLGSGLEIGRIIRNAGMTAHIGKTERIFESHGSSCDTWWDEVNSGICASSCAYAFLGGLERFVNSPYYPTDNNILGFHQFSGGSEYGMELLSADEVKQIESSTLSIAQVITGEIVLYALEMGIDARIIAFASATSSDQLYYPTIAELDELSIVSGTGLSQWFMEPYGDGLVTAAKPRRTDSMLQQITAFCNADNRLASFLITMDLATPSYPNPKDLPLNGVQFILDSQQYLISKKNLKLRYGDGLIIITVPVEELKIQIASSNSFSVSLDAARVMGGFHESRSLNDLERQSIALAWKNCI